MPRDARRLRNQALFREVNDRIAAFSAEHEPAEPATGFVCECRRLGCAELVQVPLEVYELVRGDPTAFLVARGHQDPVHETIVSDQGDYLIITADDVRKVALAAVSDRSA